MWYISDQHWLSFTTSYGPTLDFMADICDSGSVQLLGSSGRAGRVQRQRRRTTLSCLSARHPVCYVTASSVRTIYGSSSFGCFFLLSLM